MNNFEIEVWKGTKMSNSEELAKITKQMVIKGKGILAADESTGTCTKRLNSINVEYHFFIYPGAPLINSKDLIKAFKIIREK